MITVNLAYISEIHASLLLMLDEEAKNFDINDVGNRSKVFDDARDIFKSFGPKAQQSVLLALDYLLSTHSAFMHWEKLFHNNLALNKVKDKEKYLFDLHVHISWTLPDYSTGTKNKAAWVYDDGGINPF